MIILVFLVNFLIVNNVLGDVVILEIRSEADPSKELNLCALKKPFADNDTNIRYPLVNIAPTPGPCFPFTNTSIQGSAEYISIDTTVLFCSFNVLASNLQANDPGIILIGSDGPFRFHSTVNYFKSFIFFPSFMANQLDNFLSENPNSSVLVSSSNTKFDWSLIVIWFIALSSIIIGALWSRLEFNKLLSTKKEPTDLGVSDDEAIDENAREKRAEKEAKKRKKEEEKKSMITLSVGYCSIFFLLVIVCSILLLLYFFYNVMIYFVYFLFATGSATALYRIGCLILNYIPICTWKLPENNIPYFKDHRFEYRKVLLYLCTLSVSVIWFVYRHSDWIWTIQNLMAFALSINALSYYRLETYKSITILLSVFFFYDIFMVFITPQFTNGTSIMEAVAFGGRESQSNQQTQDWNNLMFSEKNTNSNPVNRLPVVITVPHLSLKKRICDYYYEYSYSLLGLGDILIPGISVNYAIIFDTSIGNKFPIYFLINIFAYFLGLMFAFIGLTFMNTAQPALLYLCPTLIIASLIISLLKGQFKEYWFGIPIKNKTSPKENKSFNDGHTSVNLTHLEP